MNNRADLKKFTDEELKDELKRRERLVYWSDKERQYQHHLKTIPGYKDTNPMVSYTMSQLMYAQQQVKHYVNLYEHTEDSSERPNGA